MRGNSFITVLLCALSAPALADQNFNGVWQRHTVDGVAIQSRELAPGKIEVVAEGTLEATVQDVEDVIRRGELHSKFMPYVKQSHVLRKKGAVTQSYTLLEFAFMFEPRDFITELTVLQSSKKTNTFHCTWTSTPDALPEKDGVLRVKVNEGEWKATGMGPRTQASYRFVTTPEGMLPSFTHEFARTEGVLKVFAAIEREANDRAFKRRTYGKIRAARNAARR